MRRGVRPGHGHSDKGLRGGPAPAGELKRGSGRCATPALGGGTPRTPDRKSGRGSRGRARGRAWPRPEGTGTRARTCPRANIRGVRLRLRDADERGPPTWLRRLHRTRDWQAGPRRPRPRGRPATARAQGRPRPRPGSAHFQAPPFPRGARGNGAGPGPEGGAGAGQRHVGKHAHVEPRPSAEGGRAAPAGAGGGGCWLHRAAAPARRTGESGWEAAARRGPRAPAEPQPPSA